MYRIAIVEDDQNAAEVLRSYLQRYEEENGEQFSVSSFANGLLFLKEQESGFDIVFMDIEMPALDGMETAKLLRRVNDISCLIFVTNMASYAIKGYEVDAIDRKSVV